MANPKIPDRDLGSFELLPYLNMRIPVIQGVIDRRVLVNYHVEPDVIARLLPAPFRPKVFRDHAIAGICLIRLTHLRPRWMPFPGGIRSENAAHRIAVEWDDNGQRHEGVFIPRRDTSSRLNAWAGGRLFPGEHHLAKFETKENHDQLSISMKSNDGTVHLHVDGRMTISLPGTSVFRSLDEASAFFEAGSHGYSATKEPGRYDGLELRCRSWSMAPLDVRSIESSFFADSSRFPMGSAALDCALVMRGIAHEWRSLVDLRCGDSDCTTPRTRVQPSAADAFTPAY